VWEGNGRWLWPFQFFIFSFAVHLEELLKIHEHFFMFVAIDIVAKILMKYNGEVTKNIYFVTSFIVTIQN
jgi:hypothetical protein